MNVIERLEAKQKLAKIKEVEQQKKKHDKEIEDCTFRPKLISNKCITDN